MDGLMKPVDVIAMHSANGEIRPLRLRIEDENCEPVRVNIDRVIRCKEIRYVGMEARVFLCSGVIGDRKWIFELKYTVRSHCWTLIRSVT